MHFSTHLVSRIPRASAEHKYVREEIPAVVLRAVDLFWTLEVSLIQGGWDVVGVNTG